MQERDRFCNMLFIAMALVVWVAVAQVVTTTYPRDNPTTGLVGAGFIGLACGLTTVPVFWLVLVAALACKPGLPGSSSDRRSAALDRRTRA